MSDFSVPGSQNFIVLRQSPDWLAMTAEEFEAQARRFCQLIGEPVESVVETARLWDSTFAVSFRQTRAAMKRIALDNLRQVRDATLLLGQADALSSPADSGPGIYFFCDDDDWTHPDTFRLLHQSCGGEAWEAYVWPHIAFGQPDGPIVRVKADNGHCSTNNYAVTADCMRRGPEIWGGVYQHFNANKIFPSLRVCRVRQPLSATNKNPSSTMFLRNNLRNDFTAERLVWLVTEFCRRLRDPAAIAELGDARFRWMRPCAEAVRDFYENLLNNLR